ncbi:cardiolipin synthase [Haloferula sp.]|uniref:cardiolipin synthase n=1 Tax=Haloferula sp. TaxID=2497595 RepID=UPI00329D7439
MDETSQKSWLDRHPRCAALIGKRGTKRRRLIAWIVLIAHVTGALTSVQAIMETRTSQGAVAWVATLNTIPYVAVPAYWVFGRTKFNGYVSERRTGLAMAASVWEDFPDQLRREELVARDDWHQPMVMEKLARMPATLGNDAELLIDGDQTFESIFEGIRQAQDYVLVQFYIIKDDEVGQELKECLIERAEAGVKCRLMYDEIGSRLPKAYLSELKSAGVDAYAFNTTKGSTNRFQINFRNHRKIVIVDGQHAWVGGLNVGKEYKGLDPDIGYWRDTHLKVTGPVVQCVQVPFVEDWQWASGELLSDLDWTADPAASGVSRRFLCLPSGPADEFETCTLFFLQAINSAKESIWIASPYFVPDEQLVSALQLAALRGVEIKILVPMKTDNKLVGLSAWSYLKELEVEGIGVYRYTKGFMHHKVMLVDDHYGSIGTANFDNRSFRLNFEISMGFADDDLAQQVKAMLTEDLSHSTLTTTKDLDEKGYWFNFLTRSARLMAPVQ